MKLRRVAFVLSLLFAAFHSMAGQTSPNLENGWKPYGSYDSSHLDTVNLMNGNLMLHAPVIPDIPQRGELKLSGTLYASAKNWQVSCFFNSTTQQWQCSWQKGGGDTNIVVTPGNLMVHRTLDKEFGSGQTLTTYAAYGYTLITPDGATHQLHGSGPQDANGIFTVYDSIDLSGYHVVLSGPDPQFAGVLDHVTITDRAGNQYQGDFGGAGNCSKITQVGPNIGGAHPPIIDDEPTGDQYCSQVAYGYQITDSNGNWISTIGPFNPNPLMDTLGRALPLTSTGATDISGCVSSHTIGGAQMFSYKDPNGVTQYVKACWAEIPIQTAFNQPNPFTPSVMVGEAVTGQNNVHVEPIVTLVLADGTYWSFDYDNYGELTHVKLPTGGSITYTWTTINFLNCNVPNYTKLSRAVATRTLDDGQGHTLQTIYQWGTATSSGLTNTVTDPLGNDTVHIFTALIPQGSSTPSCDLFETSTIQYQGSAAANHPLQRVDTTYSSALVSADVSSVSPVGNVFATDIVTTVYPSGKVKKVHKDPDAGLGPGLPIFGNVIKELEYDWGQGAPGALLRETDTVYQWQKDSSYLTAHLLDLPASQVVVSPLAAANTKSGCPINAAGGTTSCMAETDYSYDETNYLTTPVPAVTTQHVAPPYGVRGNQTTVSHWLNTTNGSVVSHSNWYDTGEVYQKVDPLGHTTTYTYDPAYVGAYVTQTCSPTTNGGATTHCVSGTYDFNTGVLTSLTNENATTQASGNTQGDSAHTSNYSYDSMFRITSAQAPPDPANSGLRAQNTFNFSAPNVFPITVQRVKSVTAALSDSATSSYDGLGRVFKTQHAVPGNTATVDTTFDQGGHVATVSNPYFSTSDATYGITTNIYDGLDRVIQTTEQDGSVSKVKYSVATTVPANGDCNITTDEAGHDRGACTDALGRLVEVDEPNPGATVSVNNYATMQTDGNFVLYNPSNSNLWSTGTSGTNASSIFMQDDGNLVLYIFKWFAGTYAAPTVGSYPAQTCSIGTYLIAGGRINANQCIVSPHGQYLLYMDPGGNFYIYDIAHGTGTWGANTAGHPGAYATLQTDGNFVVYASNGVALWNSGTSGTFAERLDMEDDGRIVIYKSAWNSGTSSGQFYGTVLAHPGCDVGTGTGWTGMLGAGQCFVSPNGHFELLLQADGNLVLYDRTVTPNHALWQTSTAISAADPGFAMRTLYQYDALGNLTCVEQHGTATSGTGCSASPASDATSPWRVRRFTYDSLSRLLTANNPESGTISYSYDADGNLLQKTSPAANQTGTAMQTVSYCYDELHRITGKGYGAQSCPLPSPVVSYSYDSGANAKGKLVSMTDQAGTASYSYDVLGRLATETRTLTGANNAAISKTLSYEYNLDGSLKVLHYPSGAAVTYTPDSAGRTVSAVDSANGINYVTGGTYGPDGSLTGFISGNSGGFAGITSTLSYNKRLQPVNMSASAPSQTVYSIGYDFHAGNGDNGNVFGIYNYRDRDRDQTFAYDALNRLVSAQNAGTDCSAATVNSKTKYWGNSYAYDAWGNLLQKSITKCGAENLSVTADAHNWIHASGVDYQYDAAGNMTFDATTNLHYAFDQENRITGANGYTYTYDGDGNRVIKSNGNTASSGTLYWYMTPGIVAETDLAGTLKSEYVFFDGERVARHDGVNGAGGVFYYFSDHLKTASVVTDSAGIIKAESDYYPWGGELQFVNNDSNHYKFTGKERDSETNLDYFGARHYSNGLGRFVTSDWSAVPVPVPYADPSDPQSLNQYTYVRNIPTSKTDPDGHDCPPCISEIV